MRSIYLAALLLFMTFNGTAQKEFTESGSLFSGTGIGTTTPSDVLINPFLLAEKPGSEDADDNEGERKTRQSLYGIASFYSKNLEGTKTATGERFSHENLTAASNNYALNSLVRVTNVKTGKSVVVRINDRMHPRMAKKGRVVDLTLSAAKKIGLTVVAGLTNVKVDLLSQKPDQN